MDPNFLLALKIFNSNLINYWICHGTLLGLIRDKKLIEWDHDIDFALWHHEINKADLINLFVREGFSLVTDGEDYDFVTFRRQDGRFIDINLYRIDKDKKIAYSEWFISKESRLRFLARSVVENLEYKGRLKILFKIFVIFKPLVSFIYRNLEKKDFKVSAGYTTPYFLLKDFTNIEINKIIIKIPTKYTQVLECLYGINWKIPKKSFNWVKESPATRQSNKRF